MDMLDPRGIDFDSPCRLYLDDVGEIYCLVDPIDFAWAVQWRWAPVKNSTGRKLYAARSTRLAGRAGPQTRLFLHKLVLERAGLTPPSAKHTIGDHKNGDSLDNRRRNLRWATHAENSRNRFGSYLTQYEARL